MKPQPSQQQVTQQRSDSKTRGAVSEEKGKENKMANHYQEDNDEHFDADKNRKKGIVFFLLI